MIHDTDTNTVHTKSPLEEDGVIDIADTIENQDTQIRSKEDHENELDEDRGLEVEYEDEDLSPQMMIKKLKEKIKKIDTEKKEYLLGWQRSQAEYINLQTSVLDQKKRFEERGSEKTVSMILPAIDSFDMAFTNKESWEKVDGPWRVGVEYIYSQLLSSLENAGVVLVDPKEGDLFDPAFHQSVEIVPVGMVEKDGTIARVLQKGYKLNTTILRPARVHVYTYTAEIQA